LKKQPYKNLLAFYRKTCKKTGTNQFLKKEKREEKRMDKYVCMVCGYVYDPEQGDSESDIAAGTTFENLPEDWVCPVCGAGKSEFEKEE